MVTDIFTLISDQYIDVDIDMQTTNWLDLQFKLILRGSQRPSNHKTLDIQRKAASWS